MKRAIILLAMLAAAGLAGAQMFAQLFGGETWTPAELNPIAWWTFDNISGGEDLDKIASKPMTLVGSPTISQGFRGNAITTAGGKYGAFSTFPSSALFTFNVWARTDTPGADMTLLGNNGSAKGRIQFYINGQIFVEFGGTRVIRELPSLETNWAMYTFTSSVDGIRTYINGEMLGNGPSISTGSDLSSINQIGRVLNLGAFGWVGQIDDVLIFDRALTAEEITKLYTESINKNGAAW